MTAIPSARRSSLRWTRRTNSLLVFATLLVLAVVFVEVPVGWVVVTALKARQQIFAWPPVYFPDPIRWDNFSEVMTAIPFGRCLMIGGAWLAK